jgi:hypothetical protein
MYTHVSKCKNDKRKKRKKVRGKTNKQKNKMGQGLVEWPSEPQALSSNPSTTKKKKNSK